MIIPIRITVLRLRASPRDLADPTGLDRPTSTGLIAPSCSPSRSSCPESLQVARPSRFERQKSIEKLARAAPRHDFRRFWLDFGTNFSSFSRLHRASDSTRSAKGRTSVFCWQAQHFQGFADFAEKAKIDGNRQKSAPSRAACAMQP